MRLQSTVRHSTLSPLLKVSNSEVLVAIGIWVRYTYTIPPTGHHNNLSWLGSEDNTQNPKLRQERRVWIRRTTKSILYLT